MENGRYTEMLDASVEIQRIEGVRVERFVHNRD
jgi:hypothetical protein